MQTPLTPMAGHPPLAEAFERVRERIRAAALRAGRPADSVRLLAATKTFGPEVIAAAAALGQREFGENYVQEALAKMQALAALDALQWHFIGPIQSNKTRAIAAHFAWVQSVDRLAVARRLAEQRPAELPPLQVLLQVNIDAEDSKSGVAPQALAELAQAVAGLPRLCLRGLMAIPRAQDDPVAQRAPFARMRALFEELQRDYPTMDTLSLGMSADFEAAIAEGSTLVRIGTALFGERK